MIKALIIFWVLYLLWIFFLRYGLPRRWRVWLEQKRDYLKELDRRIKERMDQ